MQHDAIYQLLLTVVDGRPTHNLMIEEYLIPVRSA